MVGSACVQCRAFSQELPPESFSRDGRVTALRVCGVLAPLQSVLFTANAGGTAEGLPFVPNCGMRGFFIVFSHNNKHISNLLGGE